MRCFLSLILGLLASALSARAQTHELQKFEGTTATTTAPFTVGDKWEVVWDTPAPLRITLLSADGTIVAGTAGMFRGSFYQPKGGTFYLQVNGSGDHPMAPWHLSVVELSNAPGNDSPSNAASTFVPPSVLPPGSAPATAPVAASAPSPAPIPPPVPPVVNLTDDQTRAVVMIEGDNSEGTGFLVKTPDGPAVITNLHVLANNPNIKILTNTGEQIVTLGLKGAVDRDLAMFMIKDADYSYLDLSTDISHGVQTGDDVITPGNSEGGRVVLSTHGSVIAIGPDRIEFNNPIYHGNSGGPVFHSKSGKVLAVVTEAMKVDTSDALDHVSFANRNSAITNSMRYFGLRIDTVPRWETYDWGRYLNETMFLEQFHQQSRCLDSYLNSSEKTDREAGDDNDENAVPNSKLYLTNDTIRQANEDFLAQETGADAAQRLEAKRGLIFALDNLADSHMDEIENPNNFYSFDQQRARDEIAYRKALREELDSFSQDLSRTEGLARKSD